MARASGRAKWASTALAGLVALLATGSGPAVATPAAPTAPAAAPAASRAVSADPLAAQATALIAAVRRKAATLPATDEEWKGLGPEVERLAALAESEVAAGRLYTALERLADAHRYLGGSAYKNAHPDMSASLDRFNEGWAAADGELKASEAAWKAGSWKNIPAAVRGIAEIEYGQVRVLYRASRDYAAADTPSAGPHYVGQALAAMEYALALQRLRIERAPGPFPVRSYASEIAALDAKVVAVYKPPRSIDNHPDFIRIDGTLKMAAELDALGLPYGALVAWLRSERYFGALESGWTGGPRPAETLKAETAALPQRLKAAGDDSIARLLQQQAEGAIERSSNPEMAALQLAAADAVLTRAVPAWTAARDRKPAKIAEAGSRVRVTLVRWPYT